MHYTASAKFGALAVTAGGAALGISYGIGKASGAGAGEKASGAGAGAGGGAPSSRRRDSTKPAPSFGRKEQSKQPVHVNLYLGDAGDPSAALMMTKQLNAQLAKAA